MLRPGHGRVRPDAIILMALLQVSALLLIPGCNPSLEKASSFKTVFDHFRDQEDIVAIGFPPGLVGLFLSDSDPEQAELKKLIQELSAFRMLYTEEGTTDTMLAEGLRTTVSDFTSRNQYEDLFRMQGAGEDLFIRILEKDGFVREAILMMYTDGKLFVVDLRGNISLEHFTQFVEAGYTGSLTSLAELDF